MADTEWTQRAGMDSVSDSVTVATYAAQAEAARDAAQGFEAGAEAAEANAAASAAAAAQDATDAATSETNAATSEANAAASETAAAASETAAATSETNAATSETNAATSETNATASAAAALASQGAAATSEANAAASEAGAEAAADRAEAAAASVSLEVADYAALDALTGGVNVGESVRVQNIDQLYTRVNSGGHITTTGGLSFDLICPDGVVSILALGGAGDDTTDNGAIVNNFLSGLADSPRGFGRSTTEGVTILWPQDRAWDTSNYRVSTPIRVHNDNVTFKFSGEVILIKDAACGLEPGLRVGRDDYQAAAEGGDAIWPAHFRIEGHMKWRTEGEGWTVEFAGGTNCHYGTIWIEGKSSNLGTKYSKGVFFNQLQDFTVDSFETVAITGASVKFVSDDAAQAHIHCGQINAKTNGYELWEVLYENLLSTPNEYTTLTGATSGATARVRVTQPARYDDTYGAFGVDRKIGDFVDGEDLQVGGVTVATARVGSQYAPELENGNCTIERIGNPTKLNGGVTGFNIGQLDTRRFYSLDTKEIEVSTAYSVGDEIIPPETQQLVHGWQVYGVVTVAGTTDSVETTWPTTPGSTFTSGGVTIQVYERAPWSGVLCYARDPLDPSMIDDGSNNDGEYGALTCQINVGAWFCERINRYCLEVRGGAPAFEIGTVDVIGVKHSGVGGLFTNFGEGNGSYLSIGHLSELNPNRADGGTTETTTMLHNWGGDVFVKGYHATFDRGGAGQLFADGLDPNKTRLGFDTFGENSLIYSVDFDTSPQELDAWEPSAAYSVGDLIRPTGSQRLVGTGTGFVVGEKIVSQDELKYGVCVYSAGGTIGVLLGLGSLPFETSDTVTGVTSAASMTLSSTGKRRSNAYLECTTAGTSGTGEPSWALAPTFGNTISDNTVTWTYRDYGTGHVTGESGSVTITHSLHAQPIIPKDIVTSWDTGVICRNISATQTKLTFSNPAPFGNGGCVALQLAAHRPM